MLSTLSTHFACNDDCLQISTFRRLRISRLSVSALPRQLSTSLRTMANTRHAERLVKPVNKGVPSGSEQNVTRFWVHHSTQGRRLSAQLTVFKPFGVARQALPNS